MTVTVSVASSICTTRRKSIRPSAGFAPSGAPAGSAPELPGGMPACSRSSTAVWMSILALISQATNWLRTIRTFAAICRNQRGGGACCALSGGGGSITVGVEVEGVWGSRCSVIVATVCGVFTGGQEATAFHQMRRVSTAGKPCVSQPAMFDVWVTVRLLAASPVPASAISASTIARRLSARRRAKSAL